MTDLRKALADYLMKAQSPASGPAGAGPQGAPQAAPMSGPASGPASGLPFPGGSPLGGLFGGSPQGGLPQSAQPGGQPLSGMPFFGGLFGGVPRDQQSVAAFAQRAQDMLAGGQTGISGLLNLFMGGALPAGAQFHEGPAPAGDAVPAYFQRNPSPGARAGMLGNAAQRFNAAPATRNRAPSFGASAFGTGAFGASGGRKVKF